MTATATPPNVIAPEVCASRFSWNGTDAVTFASDLGYRAGQIPGGRAYADSMDWGLTLVSPRTGSKVTVFLSEEDEGKWVFTGSGLTVAIYND